MTALSVSNETSGNSGGGNIFPGGGGGGGGDGAGVGGGGRGSGGGGDDQAVASAFRILKVRPEFLKVTTSDTRRATLLTLFYIWNTPIRRAMPR